MTSVDDDASVRLLPMPWGCPVQVAAARVPAVRPRDTTPRYASGWGETPAEALQKCRMEMAERISAQFAGDEQIERAVHGALGAAAVRPPEIMLFSEQQYELHDALRGRSGQSEDHPGRWRQEIPIGWVRATAALASDEAWLPAGLCFLGYTEERPAGLVPADTNGIATGASIEDAAVRAFMELVERDAVAIWWYNRLVRKQLDPIAFHDPLLTAFADWSDARERPLRLINLTHDLGVPVVGAITHDLNGRFIALGFGSAASAKEAARHAVGELAQFECNIALIEQRIGGRGEAGVAPEARALLQWWKDGTLANCPHLEVHPIEEPPDDQDAIDLGAAHAMCRSLGLRFYALDMTRSMGAPAVVRVFVPGLRPMWQRFAPGRLYDVPVQLGWLARRLRSSELNPTPLMF
jgi:thiazole/oxazole-forming peptide maturase SagD family component